MPTKAAVRKLMSIIRSGSVDSVRALLDADPAYISTPVTEPPKKDDGQIALQIALKCGQFEIANLLLDRGSDVNFIETATINEWRAPVLHDALRAALLCKDSHTACAVVKRMLELGASAGARDSYGNCCLGRIAMDVCGRAEKREIAAQLVECLMDHGADPKSGHPDRPAVESSKRRNESYAVLVEGVARAKGGPAWQSLLWQGDLAGLEKVMRASGTDQRDSAGRTPLHIATIYGSVEAVRMILNLGAEVDARDAADWTALGLAWESFEISALLLERGASPNVVQGDGYTPFTASFFKKPLAELMLAHGADPGARNPAGLSYPPPTR